MQNKKNELRENYVLYRGIPVTQELLLSNGAHSAIQSTCNIQMVIEDVMISNICHQSKQRYLILYYFKTFFIE